jgi:uncharacterized protein YndB with AHSA1/START domain
MSHPLFIISEKFPISRERMFGLWTRTEHLKNWFGPAGVEIVQHASGLGWDFCATARLRCAAQSGLIGIRP